MVTNGRIYLILRLCDSIAIYKVETFERENNIAGLLGSSASSKSRISGWTNSLDVLEKNALLMCEGGRVAIYIKLSLTAEFNRYFELFLLR